MELREMSESCENQEKDVTLNNNGATDAAETTKNENISGEATTETPTVDNIQATEADDAAPAASADYSTLDKPGLVAALEEQLQKPIESIRDDVNLIKIAFYSLRNAEIAAKLKISTKTVEFHISRVLKVLRIRLKDYLLAFLIFFLQ